MSNIRRVLVTGSRTWSDERQLADALFETRQQALRDGADGILVVHAAGSEGAVAQAAAWCTANGVPAEAHAADRGGDGADADRVRDQRMVDAGAEVCLAFIGPCTSGKCRRPKPHNAHDGNACAELAKKAGIPVRRRTADEDAPAT